MKTVVLAVAMAVVAAPAVLAAAAPAEKCGEPWLAALDGDVAMVRTCLDEGMPAWEVDDKGHTILMYAALKGRSGVVKLLLERGADANAVAQDGQTALIEATLSGDAETVRLLLARGASVRPRIAVNGRALTALGLAQAKGLTEIAQLLRAAGARTQVGGQLWQELSYAVSFGDGAKVRAVLEQGADAEFDPYLLAVAAWEGKTDIVTALLDYGAPIDAASEEFGTPLIAATERARVELVRLLLARGANVNATDRHGNAPLWWVQRMRGPSMGADSNARYDEIERLLRAAGAR